MNQIYIGKNYVIAIFEKDRGTYHSIEAKLIGEIYFMAGKEKRTIGTCLSPEKFEKNKKENLEVILKNVLLDLANENLANKHTLLTNENTLLTNENIHSMINNPLIEKAREYMEEKLKPNFDNLISVYEEFKRNYGEL